jgi:hypothetical protein
MTQQIEVAKLETAKFLDERRLADNESQEMTNIQTDIDNRIKLARLWGVTDWTGSLLFFMESPTRADYQRTSRIRSDMGVASCNIASTFPSLHLKNCVLIRQLDKFQDGVVGHTETTQKIGSKFWSGFTGI